MLNFTSHIKSEAERLDGLDELGRSHLQFNIPTQDKIANNLQKNSTRPCQKPLTYFCGHSLGAMPKRSYEILKEEMNYWSSMGVEGHFENERPWFSYHEQVTNQLAKVVGAKPSEVVAQNTLTTNLHLLFVSFYQPKKSRFKILIEPHAFPSDHYALQSQVKFHGYDPNEAIIEIPPLGDQHYLDQDHILQTIEKHQDELALIYLSGVHYLTGQCFPMEKIAKKAQELSIPFGLDLAHAAGNVKLKLHEWGVDFALWCTYKYLNSGPGGIGALFVHEKTPSKRSSSISWMVGSQQGKTFLNGT